MKPTRRSSCFLITLGLMTIAAAIAPNAHSQAYCALRDPVTQIYKICPKATAYRSIVRTVDETARDAIVNRVPYPMHFTELGRHTLYVGLNEQRPIRLVQSRSERSRYGLVEVVWSFDLNLRVTRFMLQRCRAPETDKQTIRNKAFKQLVAGRSGDELIALLSEDGKSLTPEARAVITGNPDLAVVILRCGIKTLAAAEAVWSSDVATSRLWHHALGYFPQTDNLLALNKPQSPPLLTVFDPDSAAIGPSTHHQSPKMYLAQKDGETLGFLSQTDCQFSQQSLSIWWGIDTNGKIMGIKSGSKLDALTKAALKNLKGHNLKTINHPDCSGPLQLIATEVLNIATAQLESDPQ